MAKMIKLATAVLLCVTLAACNGEAAEKELDYDQTKKMVVDILQTEDGKKALRELLADEKMKQKLVMESDVVKQSIQEALSSDKGQEMWKKLFEDPEFVKDYAKSLEDEQKNLMKKLMNDPNFQKQMLDLLQDPEMTSHLQQLMKSQEFRTHLNEMIHESLDSPLFQEKIQKTLLKAAEKQGKEKQSDKGGEQEGGQSQENEGGGESGGGGDKGQE
ncbi:spore germination lipoprotein GerD [Ornithinibacillus gellani]|uniref:spore germination lipoprotein GerD n=1 Tax=Ornithinibacillus gellani TaxID=2293253 RepID=UPI001CC20E1A|nr:spore germination lipoprotein GerD [Ornithinibacillus gellani]